MGHGQYLVYSSKSSIFEECIIVFQVLVYKQMLSFFEECIFRFPSPSSISKKKISRILLSINLNFGCSSYNELDKFDDVNELDAGFGTLRCRVPWLHHPRSEQVALLVPVSLRLPFFRSTLDTYWSFPGHPKVSVSIPGGIRWHTTYQMVSEWYQNGSEWY